MFGVGDLALRRHHVGGAAFELSGDRFDDGRIGMSMDERCHVVREIDARVAIKVRQAAPFSEGGIGWMRLAEDRVSTHATRQDALCTFEEFCAV